MHPCRHSYETCVLSCFLIVKRFGAGACEYLVIHRNVPFNKMPGERAGSSEKDTIPNVIKIPLQVLVVNPRTY